MTRIHALLFAAFAMCMAVTASNILVHYPFQWFGFEQFLTYGAFIYPFAFLINDLTNRRYGPQAARCIVYAGFIAGLAVSWFLANPRTAIASGAAFLFAQLLDIAVFTPLRQKSWWQAPLAAAFSGSVLDTILFFSIAFAASFGFIDVLSNHPDQSILVQAWFLGLFIPGWLSLAIGDLGIKIVMAVCMLIPYRILLAFVMPVAGNRRSGT